MIVMVIREKPKCFACKAPFPVLGVQKYRQLCREVRIMPVRLSDWCADSTASSYLLPEDIRLPQAPTNLVPLCCPRMPGGHDRRMRWTFNQKGPDDDFITFWECLHCFKKVYPRDLEHLRCEIGASNRAHGDAHLAAIQMFISFCQHEMENCNIISQCATTRNKQTECFVFCALFCISMRTFSCCLVSVFIFHLVRLLGRVMSNSSLRMRTNHVLSHHFLNANPITNM